MLYTSFREKSYTTEHQINQEKFLRLRAQKGKKKNQKQKTHNKPTLDFSI